VELNDLFCYLATTGPVTLHYQLYFYTTIYVYFKP